jgi:hypothetical protein
MVWLPQGAGIFSLVEHSEQSSRPDQVLYIVDIRDSFFRLKLLKVQSRTMQIHTPWTDWRSDTRAIHFHIISLIYPLDMRLKINFTELFKVVHHTKVTWKMYLNYVLQLIFETTWYTCQYGVFFTKQIMSLHSLSSLIIILSCNTVSLKTVISQNYIYIYNK